MKKIIVCGVLLLTFGNDLVAASHQYFTVNQREGLCITGMTMCFLAICRCCWPWWNRRSPIDERIAQDCRRHLSNSLPNPSREVIQSNDRSLTPLELTAASFGIPPSLLGGETRRPPFLDPQAGGPGAPVDPRAFSCLGFGIPVGQANQNR